MFITVLFDVRFTVMETEQSSTGKQTTNNLTLVIFTAAATGNRTNSIKTGGSEADVVW